MLDAMVPIPAARMVHSSERVISFKWGRTVRADSMPTKMLLETHRDSAPLNRMNRVKRLANPRINQGITFR